MSKIELAYKGHFGAVTKDGSLILQRRGVSTTLEVSTEPVHYGLCEHAGLRNKVFPNRVAVNWYSNVTKQSGVYAAANWSDATHFLMDHSGMKIHPTTMAYMFGWVQYDYQKADKILSACCYEPYSDTIRHVITNHCLVAFTDGRFDQPDWDVDAAMAKHIETIKDVIRTGFHDCDTRKGDDYCKRRLAWLLGEKLLSDEMAGMFVEQNMERPELYS